MFIFFEVIANKISDCLFVDSGLFEVAEDLFIVGGAELVSHQKYYREFNLIKSRVKVNKTFWN